MVKNPPANVGDIRDTVLIFRSGRYPGGGHGNPLQYSYLENPMDRGVWWAIVHKVAKNWTGLSIHACMSLFADQRNKAILLYFTQNCL